MTPSICALRDGSPIEVVLGDLAGPPGSTWLRLNSSVFWVREPGGPWYSFWCSTPVRAWAAAADSVAELAEVLYGVVYEVTHDR